MDPVQWGNGSSPHRLPRSRGDGPRYVVVVRGYNGAPPLARGWTPARERSGGMGPGSPARAGMDPRPELERLVLSRLPRSRGDGPRTSDSRSSRSGAPPLARGWTHGPWRVHLCAGGSPARAGMDPSRPSLGKSSRRLPRSRGDGPSPHFAGAGAELATPLARGWTLAQPPGTGSCAGSPARASRCRMAPPFP